MAYNKARAEKEWLKWKEAEEKKLRELGVDEDTIQRLHTYDWSQFKSERRFLERWEEWSPYVEWIAAKDVDLPSEIADNLLDSIEDSQLFQVLQSADKYTLQIILLKLEGCSSREIARLLGMDEYADNMRIYRLRKRLKNIFDVRYISPFSNGYIVNGSKQPFSRSLKTKYQPCGYVPAQTSDTESTPGQTV